jgi:hypothetical protein
MNYIEVFFLQTKRLIIQYLVILLQRYGFLPPSISIEGNWAVIWFFDENQKWSNIYVPYDKYGTSMSFKTEKGPKGILQQHPNVPVLLREDRVGHITTYVD